ncbi:MAG: hypothetical protein ABJC74_08675 [Gemmatimonadota bacterium]
MFSIEFITGPQVDSDGWLHAEAELMLGEAREGFEVDLRIWALETYRTHWREAIARLLAGASFTRLVTSYRGPDGAYHFTWPMWREGDLVLVHEELVLDEDLATPLNPSTAWEVTAPRRQLTEDGAAISEWEVPISALQDWLGRPSQPFGAA